MKTYVVTLHLLPKPGSWVVCFVTVLFCLEVSGRWTQADWPPADQGEERVLKFCR